MSSSARSLRPATLSVVWPDEPANHAKPSSRPAPQKSSQALRRLFEQIVEPELTRRKCCRNTIAEYRTALDHWEAWASYRLSTPVAPVTSADLADFRNYLLGKGLRPRTANKHAGNLIGAIVRKAATAGYLDAAPVYEPEPEERAAAKHYFSYEQLSALYRACKVATWPARPECDPVTAWRAAVVLYTNYGFRTQELIAYEGQMDASRLRWRNVTWDELTPRPDGMARCEYGWLSYVPRKQRRHKPQPLHLPLNACTHKHLRRLWSADVSPDEPVFAWPLCSRSFYGQWDAIVQAAGIAPRADPITGRQDRYTPRHFRKTATTWHNHYRHGIGPQIVGHADRSISSVHYDNPELAVLEAVLAFPQPDAFEREFDFDAGERQLRLF